MKLVRYKVRDFYIDRINSMYDGQGSDIMNEDNLRIIRSLFDLTD